MENIPVQPTNNSSQNNNSSTPPVIPPTPQPTSPAELAPKKSFKPLLFILASLFFLSIAGLTGYIYIINQKELSALTTQNNPSEKNPSENKQQVLATNEPSEITVPEDVVCARFTSVENALEYIDQACILDLSNTNISSLPSTVTKLTSLSSINLSGNKFAEFPTQLYQIPTLRVIDMENNELTQIPDASKLIKLQVIILTGNPIENIVTPTLNPSNPSLQIIY